MLKPTAKILNTLSQTLPDDRPITAIQVFTEKCPPGFVPLNRTYDQDADADLYREHSIFQKRQARYLCVSKTPSDQVISDIYVVGDKQQVPAGFTKICETIDTDIKAWRKKQVIYKLMDPNQLNTAITDIIICGRLKMAPKEFTFAGEINGMNICYKRGQVANESIIAPPPPIPSKNVPVNPNLNSNDDDYERLIPSYLQPSRPAPRPPGGNPLHGFSTLAAYNAIDGVPFVINPKLLQVEKIELPSFKRKTLLEIEREYSYDFTVERQA